MTGLLYNNFMLYIDSYPNNQVYMTAIEKVPILNARDLDEDFRLLAEFNSIVLAGRETEKGYGYKFVTWQRDYDGKGVGQGHYYIDNYNDAKYAKRV